MGITKEVFQAEGQMPDWSEILKMVVKGNVSENAQFFRNIWFGLHLAHLKNRH
jgi:hypothetical protein